MSNSEIVPPTILSKPKKSPSKPIILRKSVVLSKKNHLMSEAKPKHDLLMKSFSNFNLTSNLKFYMAKESLITKTSIERPAPSPHKKASMKRACSLA